MSPSPDGEPDLEDRDPLVNPVGDAERNKFCLHWQRVIWGLCARSRIQSADAEDIAQKILPQLLKAVSDRTNYRSIVQVGAYVSEAVQNQRTKLRKYTSLGKSSDPIPDRETGEREWLLNEFRHVAPKDIADDHFIDWLIEQVPESEREIYRLRHVEGLKWKAIAGRLAIRTTTLHRRYMKVLLQLRERFNKHD